MTPPGHRRLILTRHAKSAWNNPALDDRARPLNSRGRRSALELGEWLHSRGYEPDQVLCSSAVRPRLEERFIHLGLGAKAVEEPPFAGMEWYEGYVARHAAAKAFVDVQRAVDAERRRLFLVKRA